MPFHDDDTLEMGPITEPDDLVVADAFDANDIQIGSISHRGRVREINEDQYAVVRRNRTGVVLASSLTDDQFPTGEEVTWLLLVADGMGGHAAGEIASGSAIRSILEVANELSSWIMRPTIGIGEQLGDRINLYAEAIQQELQEQSEFDPRLAGMGTTVTAAYICGSSAVIANVGDSRSYLIRRQSIDQITRDHTVAQEMQDRGQDPENTRPYKHMLTRCFSTDAKPVPVDLFHVELADEAQILLCTDGLTDMVADEDILKIVKSTSSTKEASERLVSAALDGGGRDNITVVLARPESA